MKCLDSCFVALYGMLGLDLEKWWLMSVILIFFQHQTWEISLLTINWRINWVVGLGYLLEKSSFPVQPPLLATKNWDSSIGQVQLDWPTNFSPLGPWQQHAEASWDVSHHDVHHHTFCWDLGQIDHQILDHTQAFNSFGIKWIEVLIWTGDL